MDPASSVATAVRLSLPQPLTSFVGRRLELEDIRRRFDATRFLTLTGPGGCGKTRLALQTATDLLSLFADGAIWCDFVSLSDPNYVPQRFSTELGLSEQAGQSTLETITDVLAERQVLVVLDNCEHVLSACAILAHALLHRCPAVKLLATSIQALGLPEETVWPVPPLSVPGAEPAPTEIKGFQAPGEMSQSYAAAPEQDAESAGRRHKTNARKWMEYDAIRLFVERAQQVLPSFTLTAQNAVVVAAICRRLDGMPLALELAAARARLLTVEQIAERLDDAFALLTRGKFETRPQHSTLRATMEWTYQFLDGAEQVLLRRLAVFAGSFTLEMVESICDAQIAGVSALDLLSGLIEKSFVSLVPQEGQAAARYGLLETIRQYARERLEASAEAAAIRNRLLQWALSLEKQGETSWVGPGRAAWLDNIEVDHDNYRAALRWARTSRQAERGLRLANLLWRFWFTRGYWSEGRAWCEELLALDSELGQPTPDEVRAAASYNAGTFAYRQKDLAMAVRRLEHSLRHYRAVESPELTSSLNVLAMIADDQGDYERAVRLYGEALEFSRRLEHQWFVGVALVNLGCCVRNQGEYRRAAHCFEELRALGDIADLAAHAALQTGELAILQGDFARANAQLSTAYKDFQRLGDRQATAEALERLGNVAHNERRWELAEHYLRESLQISEETGDREWTARALLGMGQLARARDQFEQARELYGQCLKRSQQMNDALGVGYALRGLGLLDLAQGQTESAAALLREALQWFQTAHRPPEMVQTLENLASVLAEGAQLQFAARLMASTRTWRADRDAPIPPSERPAYDQTLERVRAAFSADELAHLDSVARKLSIDQAVAEAVGIELSTAVQVQTPAVHVFALGPTRVLVGERTVAAPEWKYNKSKELFFYLLVNPPATKERIGLDLWAEASAEQLRNYFHRTLHYMRKALGHADWITFAGGVYTFTQDVSVWCDVREFESRLAEVKPLLKPGMPQPAERGRASRLLADAIQLWRGDFLADMDVGEWAVMYRESLRGAYIQAQMDLGSLHVANAHYADAINVYQRVLASDDYFEAAHRELMRCYSRLGETWRALKHYQTQCQLLKDELGAEPSPETTLLYERLRRGDDV